MIRLLNILNESSEDLVYPYQEDDPAYDEEDGTLVNASYTFNTPEYPYKVTFNSGEYNPEDRTFDLSFGIDRGFGRKINTQQATGEGRAKKVLKTVAKIIDEFLNQYGDEEAEQIVVHPISEKHRRVYKALFSELPPKIAPRINIQETAAHRNTDSRGMRTLDEQGSKELANQKIEDLPTGKLFDDAKRIDGIFKRSKHGWSEAAEAFERNEQNSRLQVIDTDGIRITQPNIQSGKVKSLIDKVDETATVNVVEFADGERVVYDGHHRLTANWALGNNKIRVNLVKAG